MAISFVVHIVLMVAIKLPCFLRIYVYSISVKIGILWFCAKQNIKGVWRPFWLFIYVLGKEQRGRAALMNNILHIQNVELYFFFVLRILRTVDMNSEGGLLDTFYKFNGWMDDRITILYTIKKLIYTIEAVKCC